MLKLLGNSMALAIGERIRTYRELHGFSQKELAKRTGIRQPQLCRYEKGTELAGIAVLARLAAFMGYSLDYLYYGRVDEIVGKLDPMLLEAFRRLHEFSEECRRAVSESAEAHMSKEIIEKRAARRNPDTGIIPGKPKKGRNDS